MRGLFSGLTEKQRILKNFIAFNLSFLFLFASFDDVALVASILNQDQGLGNTSQAIIYVFQLISSFVWPQLLIQLLGFKISLAIGQVAFFLFFLANVFPSWATLIPTSILTGLANSLTWTILGIYFTLLSKKYSRLQNVPFLNVQTMFFGWFGCIFFFNYLLGASWLGGILQLKDLPMNSTYDYSENCGANNYPQTKLPESASKPSIKSVYILGGTLVASSGVALLITLFFVDDILDDDEEGKPIKRSKVTFSLIKHEFVEEFKNLARLSKNLDIWLLLPITFYLGYELTMIWYEFNRAFVSCLKNVNYIGWCSIVYGVVASIFSYLVGKLAKHIGLQTTIVMMLLVGLSNCIFMLSWTPRYDQGYVVFLMAATFGFTNSLATAQVRAIFGVFFPKDPTAYSGAILFETMGLILGSVLSIFFQARIKIYVYIAVIFLGVISYVWLEVRHRHRAMKKSEKEHFASVNYGNENENEVEKVDKEIFGVENPNYDYIPTNGEKESVEI